jgi:hypothetical protein
MESKSASIRDTAVDIILRLWRLVIVGEGKQKVFSEIFTQLYATLTSAQIDRALRAANASHQDWIAFLRHMETH